MERNGSNRSLITFFFLAAILLSGRFLLPRWLTYDHLSIISWDVFGYYLYLPAQFIYHDIGITDFTWLHKILEQYAPTAGFYQAYMGPAGEYVMKYPMGMAILYAPFFFLAHLLTGPLGFPSDGFSLPYQVSVALGCLLYGIIGIWFLRKVLKRYFSDISTTIAMILLVLGTNYFQLTVYDSAMVHNPLFTLYTLILWLTVRWHDDPKWRYAVPLGGFIGLAALIRPTEIIISLIPLLWCVYDRESLQHKWKLIARQWTQVTVLVLMIFLIGSFQLMYWKVHAGSFFYYSYEPTERLQWLAPYLWQVLFSFKKGWLIYTPMMVFGLAGFYWLGDRLKQVFLACFITVIAAILIVASWPTWWYGGSFGQRAMMQSYALLAFPLAAFVQWLLSKQVATRIVLFATMAFFILLNLFQTWQYMNFLIDPSLMTKEYYCRIFLKTGTDNAAKGFLEGYRENGWEVLGPEDEYNKRIIGNMDFEDPFGQPGVHAETKWAHAGMASCRLDSSVRAFKVLNRSLPELTGIRNSWIRVSFWIFSRYLFVHNPGSLVVTMNHEGMNYKYRAVRFHEEKFIPGKWNHVIFTYQIPATDDPDDRLQIYFWRNSPTDLYIDDLTVTLYEPR